MLITGCGKYLCHAATSCRTSMSVSPAARGGGHAGILSENLLQKLILQDFLQKLILQDLLQKLILQDLLQKLILQELLQKLTLQDLLQKLLVQGMQRIRNKEKVNMIFTAGGNTGHVSARFSVTEKVRKINDLFNTACRLVFNLEIIYNILSVFRRRSGLAYRNMLII
jgi:hypothetical protein